MSRALRYCSVLVIAALVLRASAPAAEPRVDLEIVTGQNFLGTESRTWSELLSKAGFSTVRMRSGGKDSPSLQMVGTAVAPAYRVTGVLSDEQQLLLPKGRFGINDRGRIEQWLRNLRESGEEGITIKPVAFGLMPRQLVAVHEALAVPVSVMTRGKSPRDVAKQIADRLTLKFTTDSAGQRALGAEQPIADELNGLSSGTALAAIFRPIGLALVPEKNGSEVRLRIADSRTVKEHWPVGWPAKGNPRETLPELFVFLTVEIDKTPVSDAMTAIAERVKAPLLIDHNAIARAGIDLQTKVSLPKANTFYDRALDQALAQAKLHYELRVDEAEKPFLWVTSIRQ
jgi:hypothetical protein